LVLAELAAAHFVVADVHVVVDGVGKIRFRQPRFEKQAACEIRFGKVATAEVALSEINPVRLTVREGDFFQVQTKEGRVIQRAVVKSQMREWWKGIPYGLGPVHAAYIAMLKAHVAKPAGRHFDVAEVAIYEMTVDELAIAKSDSCEIGVPEVAFFEGPARQVLPKRVPPIRFSHSKPALRVTAGLA
jgi:hypothetical protein